MDEPVNPLERDHSLCVVLPGGLKKNVTVHGSKPVMDLVVTLCASYHLNPSDYTVEFLSPNKNSISFKPNSPIGSLEAEKIVLKPKGTEEEMKRPYMPEATVRLLVNYSKSHKTVVRVNPRLPLEMLLPVICDKCEFTKGTTILLRDSQSKEPLDLTRTLNDHGLREVFAMDTTAKESTDYQLRMAETDLPRKEQKQRNRGFFSFFRRRKKKHDKGSVSAPVSPGFGKRLDVGVNPSNTLPADMPKKRRAPQPPASQSLPNNLSTCHDKGGQRSADSTLRSTKRRAPPPPCVTTQVTDVRVESLKSLEELREIDESPHSSQPSFSSRPSLTHLHEVANPFLPSFRGRDLSDARCALAKVLTSSLSNGMLVKRLRNSAANFYVSSCVSTASDHPDDGVFRVEHESILKSDLPTENEWDDPTQRSGLTTFKVVPLKKPASCDPEQEEALPTEDGPEAEVPSEAENNDMRTEEDPCSHRRSESPELDFQQNQIKDISASYPPLHDDDDQNSSGTTENQKEEEVPSDVAQNETSDCSEEDTSDHQLSPSSDVEPCPSYADENKAEEDAVGDEEEDEDINFPPPPPPAFFKEDTEVSETEREASTNSTPTRFQPANPPVNGHPDASGEDQEDHSKSSQVRTNQGSSRFAQAVATAVQRSRLQSLGEDLGPRVSSGPLGTLPSAPRSTYPCAPPPTLARWSDSIQL